MLYIDFNAGNKDYKLRLNTRGIVALEKKLGANPITIFGDGKQMPTFETMVTVLHASLQAYQHGITLDDAYDIFDAYLESGHDMTEFLPIIVELYKVSGIIPNKEETEKN